MKAIVLLSGGLDSAVTLAQAIAMGYDCIALTFDYGQRHKIEIEFASKLATQFKVPLVKQKVLIPANGCALLDKGLEITDENCNVPARNLIFLSHALALAITMDASNIFIGSSLEDSKTFPDASREFFNIFEFLARKTTERRISIQAPFYSTPKKRIVELAKHFGIKLEDTWSCYNPQQNVLNAIIDPCGMCLACKKREVAIKG